MKEIETATPIARAAQRASSKKALEVSPSFLLARCYLNAHCHFAIVTRGVPDLALTPLLPCSALLLDSPSAAKCAFPHLFSARFPNVLAWVLKTQQFLQLCILGTSILHPPNLAIVPSSATPKQPNLLPIFFQAQEKQKASFFQAAPDPKGDLTSGGLFSPPPYLPKSETDWKKKFLKEEEEEKLIKSPSLVFVEECVRAHFCPPKKGKNIKICQPLCRA